MLLFLHQDLANMFRHRVFSQGLALGNPVAVISDCFGPILKIELEHIPGLFGRPDLLRLDCLHAAEIIDLFGNNERVAELFLRVLFKLTGNVLFGALQHLRVNNIRNDRLVFTPQVFVQEFNQLFTGYLGLNARSRCASSH
jgi:hypothetical protein